MSEKRFIFFAEKTGQHYEILIRDKMGEEYIITDDFFRSKDVVWEIKDLLNVMNDTLLEQAKQVSKLSEENEQLRRECKSNEHLCEYYRQKYKKLLEDVQENVKGELVIR